MATTLGDLLALADSDLAGSDRDITHIREFLKKFARSAIQVLTPQMFGAVGDGVNDDWPAFAAMLAMAGRNGKTFYPKGPKCFIPAGKYKLTSAPLTGIQLKAQTIIEGDACGLNGGLPGSELLFPEDAIGFVINRYDTLNQQIEQTPSGGADCTIIRNLILTGDRGADMGAHGIWVKARAYIQNVVVRTFTGNGIHLVADAVSQDPLIHGNANCFYFATICCIGNGGHGIYTKGGDGNAGVGINIDVSSNGRWGIYDDSFLGNTWIACHSAGNGTAGVGINGATKSSFVHYEGMRYGALGTEAQLVATQPGTNEAIWVPLIAAGENPIVPNWLPGQPEGTYFQGGGYKSDGGASAVVWVGCYVEGGQCGCWFEGLTMVLGGSVYGAGFVKGGYVRGDGGNQLTLQGKNAKLLTKAGGVEVTMGGVVDSLLQWVHDDDTPSYIWRLHRSGADFVLDNANSGARIALKILGENTAETSGRSVTIPYHMAFPRLGIGSGASLRLHHSMAALPTSGEYGRGEVIWNSAPTAGGSPGWVCTTGGTAGSTAVFKAMANLAS